MKIVWASPAKHDLAFIRSTVEVNDVRAAKRVAKRILDAVESLEATPSIGRPGRIKGTRELVFTQIPYVVIYRMTAGVVEVLRVFHTARRWPPRSFGR